ncbi:MULTISPECIES: NifU family protein [unclassified Amycolatopsis]|uniref:NifU family protein n=1 Tax=unclassified Amycolatopsis TaxID=2618356 RepID=UPI002E2224FA|nr:MULTISPECIES: NifU family protein [unclassified Amycolatopsis]
MPSVRAVGDRVEELLGVLLGGPGRGPAEEIVRELMNLYGEGLARIAGVLRVRDPALLDELAGDGLLAGLLVLHDLHPLDADTRIRRALARLGGDAELLGVEDGVARLRRAGARGCGSSTSDVLLETAVLDAAPELSGVELTEAAALFQIGMGPPPGWRTAGEGRAS